MQSDLNLAETEIATQKSHMEAYNVQLHKVENRLSSGHAELEQLELKLFDTRIQMEKLSNEVCTVLGFTNVLQEQDIHWLFSSTTPRLFCQNCQYVVSHYLVLMFCANLLKFHFRFIVRLVCHVQPTGYDCKQSRSVSSCQMDGYIYGINWYYLHNNAYTIKS